MNFSKIPFLLAALLAFTQGVSAQTYCFSQYSKNGQKYKTIPKGRDNNFHRFYNYIVISDVYETTSNLLGETIDNKYDRESKFKRQDVETLTTIKAKATIEGATHDCEKVTLGKKSYGGDNYGYRCGPIILTEDYFDLDSPMWNNGIQFRGAIYKDAAYELINADYPINENNAGRVFRYIKDDDLPNISNKFKPFTNKNMRAKNGSKGTTKAFQKGKNARYLTYSYGPLRIDWGREYDRFPMGGAPAFGYVEKSDCTDAGSKTKITERLLLIPAEKTAYISKIGEYMNGYDFNTQAYPSIKKNIELFFNSDMNIPLVLEVEVFAPVRDDGTDF